MSDLPTVTAEIARLTRIFERFRGGHPGHAARISARSIDVLIDFLRLTHGLATAQEQELQVHRMAEAARINASVLEGLAVEFTTEVLIEEGGNVIRPNFRRKA